MNTGIQPKPDDHELRTSVFQSVVNKVWGSMPIRVQRTDTSNDPQRHQRKPNCVTSLLYGPVEQLLLSVEDVIHTEGTSTASA